MALIDPETEDDQFFALDEVSASFLRVIKQFYTRDTSIEVLEALAPILGKDWKARLIMGIVSNKFPNAKTLRLYVDGTTQWQKINAIKELRGLTGMGLVEAKHAIESCVNQWVSVSMPDKPMDLAADAWNRKILEAVNYLRQAGITVQIA